MQNPAEFATKLIAGWAGEDPTNATLGVIGGTVAGTWVVRTERLGDGTERLIGYRPRLHVQLRIGDRLGLMHAELSFDREGKLLSAKSLGPTGAHPIGRADEPVWAQQWINTHQWNASDEESS